MSWVEIESPTAGARAWMSGRGVAVLRSEETHDDGSRWLHVSVSRQHSQPSIAEVAAAARKFGGKSKPSEIEIGQTNANVIHLWYRLGEVAR